MLAASLLWVLIAVAPMLGLANFGYHSHADRFTYLPSIGLSLLVTGGLLRLLRLSRGAGLTGALALMVALGFLARQTVRQTSYWRNGATLCEHALEVTGANVLAHVILGLHHFGSHQDLEAAVRHFCRYFELGTVPIPFGHRSLYVMLLSETGRIEEARNQARLLNELPEGAPAEKTVASLIAYCSIALAEEDLELARQQLARLTEVARDLPETCYLLGQLAMKEGRREDATRLWRCAAAKDRLYSFLQNKSEMPK